MINPMLASPHGAKMTLTNPAYAYEPKLDGIRALVVKTQNRGARIYSREGNDKTAQFPEIAAQFKTLRDGTILDGEIVAISSLGQILDFQSLQTRINTLVPDLSTMVAYVAFDILHDGVEELLNKPLAVRRQALEDLGIVTVPHVAGDGQSLYEMAVEQEWEGLMAKRLNAPYRMGKRTDDWVKLKFCGREEFVVGGWTEPQGTRAAMGSLILGQWVGDRLVYRGNVGSGMTDQQLQWLLKKLKPLQIAKSPFGPGPTMHVYKPHWVKPEVRVEVKFNSWTQDRKLRFPVFFGVREED